MPACDQLEVARKVGLKSACGTRQTLSDTCPMIYWDTLQRFELFGLWVIIRAYFVVLHTLHRENGGSVFFNCLSRFVGNPKPKMLSRRDVSQQGGA